MDGWRVKVRYRMRLGGWDAAALWEALFVEIKLFRRLSLDVSQALDRNHDDKIHRDIETYIRRLWREDREVAPKA